MILSKVPFSLGQGQERLRFSKPKCYSFGGQTRSMVLELEVLSCTVATPKEKACTTHLSGRKINSQKYSSFFRNMLFQSRNVAKNKTNVCR